MREKQSKAMVKASAFFFFVVVLLQQLSHAFRPAPQVRVERRAMHIFTLSEKTSKKQGGANLAEREAMIREIVSQLMRKLEESDDDDDDDDDDDKEEGSDHSPDQALLNGVVRVYCTHSPPSFSMPWQRKKQEFSTSTGFAIGNNRILTNAHAVEYGSLIQVKKRQSEDKYVASVAAVGHECDLAILTVEDPSFWDNISPLKFGPLPDLLEDVSVIGYPVGGDSISISSGIVSRIEMQEYAQASAQLLAIQIDAAINPGNSGGPVVNAQDEVIGVAFQSLSEEDIENIGYVVPVNVIDHFLDDVEKHGAYSGVCGIGVRMQGMENEMLRRHYRMGTEDTGVLVLSLAPLAPSASVLKKGDVLLKIDGIRVANDCTIPFREGSFKERVQLNYYFTQRFANDVITAEVLRNGVKCELKVPLWVPQRLVPRTLLQKNFINAATNEGTGSNGSIVGGVPSYLMIGGLVMMALSREYLEAEFNTEHMVDFEGWAEEFRILSLSDNSCKEKDEEIVILSQVISHSCNIGYETYRNMALKSFNDVTVKNLKHLKSLIDEAASVSKKQSSAAAKKVGEGLQAPLVFEFSSNQVIVLEAEKAFAAQREIEKTNFIQSSSNLID